MASDHTPHSELVEQARDAINTLFGNTDVAYDGSHEAHRDAHAALDGLEEQLQAVQEDHEATSDRLRERRDENERLREQLEALENRLNKDSQHFELLARKEQLALAEARVEAARQECEYDINCRVDCDCNYDDETTCLAHRVLAALALNPASNPHDDKGFSEERCVRCGWVMGQPPLNCQNDDTPHVFPSQVSAPASRQDNE